MNFVGMLCFGSLATVSSYTKLANDADSASLQLVYRGKGLVRELSLRETRGGFLVVLPARARVAVDLPPGEYVFESGLIEKGQAALKIDGKSMNPLKLIAGEDLVQEWGEVHLQYDVVQSGRTMRVVPPEGVSKVRFIGDLGEFYVPQQTSQGRTLWRVKLVTADGHVFIRGSLCGWTPEKWGDWVEFQRPKSLLGNPIDVELTVFGTPFGDLSGSCRYIGPADSTGE